MHALSITFSDPNSSRWLFIAVASATIAYAVFRPMLKRNKDPLARTPSASSLSQQRTVEREMSNLLVELSEMTRQLSAQLDNRSAKLEELMRQADAKIAEMRAAGLLAPSSASAAVVGTPDPAIPSSHPANPLRAIGLTPAEAAGMTGPTASQARSALEAVLGSASAAQNDPRHSEIYALGDQGLSSQEIAHRLNRPAGEVELILKLRSQK